MAAAGMVLSEGDAGRARDAILSIDKRPVRETAGLFGIHALPDRERPAAR
jgi:hypothetical protein